MNKICAYLILDLKKINKREKLVESFQHIQATVLEIGKD